MYPSSTVLIEPFCQPCNNSFHLIRCPTPWAESDPGTTKVRVARGRMTNLSPRALRSRSMCWRIGADNRIRTDDLIITNDLKEFRRIKSSACSEKFESDVLFVASR